MNREFITTILFVAVSLFFVSFVLIGCQPKVAPSPEEEGEFQTKAESVSGELVAAAEKARATEIEAEAKAIELRILRRRESEKKAEDEVIALLESSLNKESQSPEIASSQRKGN